MYKYNVIVFLSKSKVIEEAKRLLNATPKDLRLRSFKEVVEFDIDTSIDLSIVGDCNNCSDEELTQAIGLVVSTAELKNPGSSLGVKGIKVKSLDGELLLEVIDFTFDSLKIMDLPIN